MESVTFGTVSLMVVVVIVWLRLAVDLERVAFGAMSMITVVFADVPGPIVDDARMLWR